MLHPPPRRHEADPLIKTITLVAMMNWFFFPWPSENAQLQPRFAPEFAVLLKRIDYPDIAWLVRL
jgi:hypothetical protein